MLGTACRGDDPGQSPIDPADTEGTSTGEDSSSSDAIDPDSTSTSTGEEEETWAEICDGSEDLRLAMTLTGGGSVGNELVREIGFHYLYVSGTCEYWVLPTLEDAPWPDTRRGTLDLEAERALSQALDYGNLAELAGEWGIDEGDGAVLLVSDGTDTVTCHAGCETGPEAAQALWTEFFARIDPLWEDSEPYLGPLRISVVGWVDSVIDELGVPWPLERDAWSIATDGDAKPGPEAAPSMLIDDPEEVAFLRELRRQYREDDLLPNIPNALHAYGHLSFTSESGQDLFQLWMRDALPLEDGSGRIELP